MSDTGELTWNRERPGKAYWTVDTPNTKLFSGFPEGREVTLNGVKLAIGPTRLGWATVSLTSRHATGFGADGASATILLTATGVAENEGTQFEVLLDRRRCATACTGVRERCWSSTCCRDAALRRSENTLLCARRARARKGDVPVESVAGGCRITIGPQYKTRYELDIR